MTIVCAVCGNPAYLLFGSSFVVPVPHHCVSLLAVELMTVNASPVSFVCHSVALGFCGSQFVLSVMFCVLSVVLSIVVSGSSLFVWRVYPFGLFVVVVHVNCCVRGVPGVSVPNSIVVSFVCSDWVQEREMWDATVIERLCVSAGGGVVKMRVR